MYMLMDDFTIENLKLRVDELEKQLCKLSKSVFDITMLMRINIERIDKLEQDMKRVETNEKNS